MSKLFLRIYDEHFTWNLRKRRKTTANHWGNTVTVATCVCKCLHHRLSHVVHVHWRGVQKQFPWLMSKQMWTKYKVIAHERRLSLKKSNNHKSQIHFIFLEKKNVYRNILQHYHSVNPIALKRMKAGTVSFITSASTESHCPQNHNCTKDKLSNQHKNYRDC